MFFSPILNVSFSDFESRVIASNCSPDFIAFGVRGRDQTHNVTFNSVFIKRNTCRGYKSVPLGSGYFFRGGWT